jgi:hypothetical protein
MLLLTFHFTSNIFRPSQNRLQTTVVQVYNFTQSYYILQVIILQYTWVLQLVGIMSSATKELLLLSHVPLIFLQFFETWISGFRIINKIIDYWNF